MSATSIEFLPDQTVLLTVKEASTRLRVSKSKLYELINKRRLESIRIGRRRLIPADSLLKLIVELREETT